MPSSCNGVAKQRHVVAQQWDSEMPFHLSFQKSPSLEELGSYVAIAIACMRWHVCGRAGIQTPNTPEPKDLTQVTRTQLQ